MKKIIKKIINLMPNIMKKWFFSFGFKLMYPHQIKSKKIYNFSDEDLKFTHLLECVNYVKVNIPNGVPPIFFEFGCHSGRTFSAIVNAFQFLKISNCEFYAFDSFEGLPLTNQKDDGIFKTATFNTSESDFIKIVKKNTGYKLNEMNTIKGFYNESLNVNLQRRMPKVGFIHIDVDLFSSTIEVLEFVKPLIVKGTVIAFDDWYCFPPESGKGESAALSKFIEENPSFKVQSWKAYSTFGKSFIVTGQP